MRCAVAAWSERLEPAARILVCLYCFCVPLGALLRFSGHRQSLGITTCCVLLLVALRVPALWGAIRRFRLLQLLAALLVLLAVGTVFRLLDPRPGVAWSSFRMLGDLAVYVLLAAAAASLNWNAKRFRSVAASLALGLALSSALTLLDYWGWADLPRFNASEVGTNAHEVYIPQAHGPFSHRTALAAYLVLALPLLLVLAGGPGVRWPHEAAVPLVQHRNLARAVDEPLARGAAGDCAGHGLVLHPAAQPAPIRAARPAARCAAGAVDRHLGPPGIGCLSHPGVSRRDGIDADGRRRNRPARGGIWLPART